MSIRISLFNHKGGVSKTTTAFNLGWMLAKKGKRVLLVDCDPQCNLTGMVLGYKDPDEFEKHYRTGNNSNIRDGLAPAFESRPTPLTAVECVQVKGQPKMYLLPGHIGLAEYEVTLGFAQEMSASLLTLQNLPGSISNLLKKTEEKVKADYTFIDMSPTLGPINQNLLMTSDYFIVPTNPDYFSIMALHSLATFLPKWGHWAKAAQKNRLLREASYPFPAVSPKFLGVIIQKYRPRREAKPSRGFEEWINGINDAVEKRLVPALREADMMLPQEVYAKFGLDNYKLLQMPDFNTLIARSQQHQTPIFKLTPEQLQLRRGGAVLRRTLVQRNRLKRLLSTAADTLIAMTSYAGGN